MANLARAAAPGVPHLTDSASSPDHEGAQRYPRQRLAGQEAGAREEGERLSTVAPEPERHETSKVQHYWLDVNAMTRPMLLREDPPMGTERNSEAGGSEPCA